MSFQYKSKKLSEIIELLEPARRENKKIVLCHGCFDLLHIGHIRHFRSAKSHGDILVVSVTPDCCVDKGPNRPAFPENLRVEAIASLDEVDYVFINEWPTAENTLRLLRPDFYAKGSEFKEEKADYTGKIDRELAVLKEIGSQIIFTEDIVFSSSSLINTFLSNTSDETKEYLQLFRTRYSTEHIHKLIDDMSSLKVLVIGDAILDDYHYCEPIGKSNKDPTLVLLHKSSDMFIGGVLAVANHIAGFVGEVTLVSVLGEQNSYEDFIRNKLHSNIQPFFCTKPNAPTLIKRRYIDGYSFNKLLEIYIMDDSELPSDRDQELCDWITREIGKYDLVVVADFGHGTISGRMVDVLCKRSAFLAVNTQANAGNRGFHTISKYPCANFVSLAEHEIRLETRKMNGPIRPMMAELAQQLGCSSLIVTRGRRGCLVKGNGDNFISIPSMTSHVVDRVGAGDAFFAISALAAAMKSDDEITGFLGNAAGSLAVEIIGNQKSIDMMSVKKYVRSIMK